MRENLRWLLIVVLVARLLFPVVPEPGPGPNPPTPDVDPAPFPAEGLTVLIVEETNDRDDIPASQLSVLSSLDVRQAASGNIRVLDHQATILEEGPWRAAMDAWKASGRQTPGIAISNGRTGIITDLPQTIDETVGLIGRYR